MFSQEYKLNVQTCDGCACRCGLGVAVVAGKNGYYPAINDLVIDKWIGANGERKTWLGVTCFTDRSRSTALTAARQIAQTCDYYKTGLMPESGVVRCMQCSLSMEERCKLGWVPCVGGEHFHAFVNGEHLSCDAKNGFDGKSLAEALDGLRMFIARSCARAVTENKL